MATITFYNFPITNISILGGIGLNISVFGSGRWGSFIAWYLNKIGHQVVLYGRSNSKTFQPLLQQRKNAYITLPPEVDLSSSLETSVAFADFLVLAIPAQELRTFVATIPVQALKNKTIILCMKGIEATTGKRLSSVLTEVHPHLNNVAIWVGPGHVQDISQGVPTCMIIDSFDITSTQNIAQTFSSEWIRFYFGQDLLGNEIGAASKNVIGIAAGMLDGLGYSSLKGALMARGAHEIARLIHGLGGNERTAYGLSHLGDYDATLFSLHSHNRRFGERFVKGEAFDKLAEGVSTVQAILKLANASGIDCPICTAVHRIVHERHDAQQVLFDLFMRPLKFEF